MLPKIISCISGLLIILVGLRFVAQEQKNPFVSHLSKKTESAIRILTIISFTVACVLTTHAAVLIPFFVIQSAYDIKDELTSVALNNILLCYAVVVCLIATPFNEILLLAVVAGIIVLLSCKFNIFGSGDAKVIIAIMIIHATGNFENDLFVFLTFLLVSYSLLFFGALIRNHIRKKKNQPAKKNMCFYPFLFAGYVIQYLI